MATKFNFKLSGRDLFQNELVLVDVVDQLFREGGRGATVHEVASGKIIKPATFRGKHQSFMEKVAAAQRLADEQRSGKTKRSAVASNMEGINKPAIASAAKPSSSRAIKAKV